MWKSCLALFVCLFGFSSPALAHFGMIIPSKAIVEDKKAVAISLELSFSHPMEMIGMPLAKPKAVRVVVNGKTEDLSDSLKAVTLMGHDAWEVRHTVKKPGVYQFVVEPQPYWEAAEDRFIIHSAKTYVAAFGEEEGWDQPLGLRTEIVPLSRPFGNYAGNVFQGQVLLAGKPVPNAQVEVAYYNREGHYAAPNEYMLVQALKADADGIFTYGVPFAGWWGFAALNTADEKIMREGCPKELELGAVIWVEFVAPLRK